MLRRLYKIDSGVIRRCVFPSILGGSRAWSSTNIFGVDSPNEVKKWVETLDPILQKKVRFFQNELTVRSLESDWPVDPDTLTVDDYQKLLEMSSRDRKRYYNYVYKIRLEANEKNASREIKRLVTDQDIQKKTEKRLSSNESGHIEYGLGKCSLIPRIFPRNLNEWKNRKLYRHMLLPNEQKLIFDCGFENEMSGREIHDIVHGLVKSFAKNRDHRAPFTMHLCNINTNGFLWRNLSPFLPKKKPMPILLHDADYIDIFTKSKLVVLTNDSPNLLTEYDPNVHYVLGAVNRRDRQNPFMLAKAKECDIQTARMPFDKFCRFRAHKSLPLDQLTDILLEVRSSRDWNRAFEFIDSNKLQ